MFGRIQKEWLDNIAENSQQLIDFIQTEDRGESYLSIGLPTQSELNFIVGFRVSNHVHSFLQGYFRVWRLCCYNVQISLSLYKVDYPDDSRL